MPLPHSDSEPARARLVGPHHPSNPPRCERARITELLWSQCTRLRCTRTNATPATRGPESCAFISAPAATRKVERVQDVITCPNFVNVLTRRTNANSRSIARSLRAAEVNAAVCGNLGERGTVRLILAPDRELYFAHAGRWAKIVVLDEGARLCTMCAPVDQEKSHHGQCEQTL